MAEVQRRGLWAVQNIVKTNEMKTVLIATHAGFLRAMQCFWLRMPLDEMRNISWMPNASITEIDYENGKYHIIRLGETAFLDGAITKLAKGI